MVIDWGGSILSEARLKVDGLPAQVVEFQARPEDGELRRYIRTLVVRGDRKLTVQASSPVAGFGAVKATWQALVGSLRWREPSSPERV